MMIRRNYLTLVCEYCKKFHCFSFLSILFEIKVYMYVVDFKIGIKDTILKTVFFYIKRNY